MSQRIIDEFQGEYFFLSNFYNAKVKYGKFTYGSVEAAFQAQKCSTDEAKRIYTQYTAFQAKWHGRRETINRAQWDAKKDQIMYELVKNKFMQHPDLKKALIDTGDDYLIEGNDWHDNYWGNCHCKRCSSKPARICLDRFS